VASLYPLLYRLGRRGWLAVWTVGRKKADSAAAVTIV
jgi:hypothetical protein